MVKIAIIGYGYWGPNLVRNFMSLQEATVTHVADIRKEKLADVGRYYPSVKTSTIPEEVILAPETDAVVIATSVNTHYELAKASLHAGKHVLVEKPLAMNEAEAKELIDLALQKNLVLMIDHTFLYTGAVQKVKELLDKGEIGRVNYFDSTRINLGLFQHDVNVLWDLAPHDISILNYLTGERPVSLNATGISHTRNGIENIAYLTLNYQSDMIAHFNCSWSSPVKIRNILIGGDKKMIVYNDMEPTEKIKVYNCGYSHSSDEEKRNVLIDYRIGDIHVPKLDTREALYKMAQDFSQCIIFGKKPLSDALSGLEVIKILQAAGDSIGKGGKEIKLNF